MFDLGRWRHHNLRPALKPVTTHECHPTTGMAFILTRKKIKGVYLRIGRSDAQLQVNAPHHLALPQIHQILLEKQDWILKKQAQIKTRQSDNCRLSQLNDGSIISLFGQDHRISVHLNCEREQTIINDGSITVHTRADTLNAIQLQRVITEQLEAILRHYLTKRLPYWCEQVGVQVSFMGIKQMKTRWGSCHIRDRRIWLNLALIHMPKGCIDMVLVHELVHLHERYHNARFYAFMDQFLPDWRTWHQHLKLQGISEA